MLCNRALELMKEQKDIEELIKFYDERTQYYKVGLLRQRLNKVMLDLEELI